MSTTQTAQAQFGVAVGANFDQLADIEGERQATFDNASGFHVGIFYDFTSGAFAVRPGLYYMNVGTFDVRGVDPAIDRIDFDMFEVPLDVRLRIFAAPLVRPYLLAGPTLRIARTDDEGFRDSMNNLSVAGNAGVGVEIGIPGAPIRLHPEFRYAFGLTRFADDMEFLGNDIEFVGEDTFRLNTFMLRLGVTF